MKSRFDQSEEIRDRLRSKKKKSTREKRVLNSGNANPKTVEKNTTKNKNAVPNECKDVFGVKMNTFVRELNKRPNISPLYKMADELMAGVIFANGSVIQEITDLLNSGKVQIKDPEQSKSLLQQLKGATAEVVNGLKALGVAASNRAPEIAGDAAMQKLTELDLEKILPPSLQMAYLGAQEDLLKTEGGGVSTNESKAGETRESIVRLLKAPIKQYATDDPDSPSESSPSPEDRVHDPKKDGLVIQ